MAGHGQHADDQVQQQGGLGAVAARRALLLEAERLVHVGSWVFVRTPAGIRSMLETLTEPRFALQLRTK